MRDSLCKLDTLNNDIEFELKSIQKRQEKISTLKLDLQNGVKTFTHISNEQVILNTLATIRGQHRTLLMAKYSRGDEISSLKNEFEEMYNIVIEITPNEVSGYLLCELVALGVLLEVDGQKIRNLLNIIDEVKLDYFLLDKMCILLGYQRNNSSFHIEDKTDKFLVDIIDKTLSKNDTTKEFCEYMVKNWYKNFYGSGYKKAHTETGYVGMWNIVGAALAKMLGIDDSGLKNDNHYPYDLRHYKNTMMFAPIRTIQRRQEEPTYKQGIAKFPKLEPIIPLPFHEKINQFIIDYKELNEKALWDKYGLKQLWVDVNDYIKDIKKHGTLGIVIINVLVNFGFILQLDYKEDISDYEVKNFWGDEPVKLVQFDLGNDQYYCAYIPKSTELETIFDVKIYDVSVDEIEQGELDMDR